MAKKERTLPPRDVEKEALEIAKWERQKALPRSKGGCKIVCVNSDSKI